MKVKTIELKDTLPSLLKKTRFLEVERLEYKYKGIFAAGLVRHSPHKSNTVYLQQGDLITHLRHDEAIAIIRCLSMAMWCYDIYKKNGFPRLKWRSYDKIIKEVTRV